MTPPYHVLFVCTGNACRSQMGEALLRKLGSDRFVVHSAGSHPAGYIHPIAIETMNAMNIPLEGQHSKGFDAFNGEKIDIVLTVCDAAADYCPAWPNGTVTAHWGLPDPSFFPGTDDERRANALAVAQRLAGWIEKMIALPIDSLKPEQLRRQLQAIPQQDENPSPHPSPASEWR